MSRKVVVAIDLGTTGNRAIAFEKSGRVAAQSYYEFTQFFPRAGWVEHDPHEILTTACRALQDVLKRVGARNVVSMGITNQRETTILWDRRTGKPVYRAIVWQDRRTEKICRVLKAHRSVLKRKTGLFLDPYFSATKIQWILENVGGLRARIKKGDILFGTPETWLLWNLTRGKSHLTEPSNASRTLLLNLKTAKYDPDLLKIFHVPRQILPEIRSSDSIFGYTDKRVTGTPIPIAGILGDQQAALFAHAGWEKGIVKATYGTGIFVLGSTHQELCHSDKLVTTIAWQTGKDLYYALEGSVFMGGASVQWLRDNLRFIKKSSESESIAKSMADNEGIYFVPAFQGLGAPYWDPNARALLIGLSRKANTDNIVRAVLESLAYQVRDVMEEMTRTLHGRFKILRVDGGACANNWLMQFQADLLRMPVDRPKVIETTALGAAVISGMASGFWTREHLRQLRRIDRVFSPRMNKRLADGYYAKWKNAVARSLKWA
ncbi:MAG: glycerol kinase GlpK [Candidatus Omnitrophica bacterium]|nr:glycerol kinase GlpK [Candidatus Omnitrophota bacterium]MDD5670351.1 glycerol kinase GlpK [Candidatus Omnitrophota bacterium]